ncbi:MAG: hypothetical protein HZA03_04875 [Nitrospinae bacterium]|nr:hypothetical protein [Nitrospinota bacterium]
MRFKNRFPAAMGLFMAFLILPDGASAAREKVPSALQMGGSIILPKGNTELGFGGDIIQRQDGDTWYAAPAIYFRHGLTDSLELIPLGVRWRVVNLPARGYQAALKARLAGANDNSAGRQFTSWEAAAEGKLRLDDEMSVTYYVGNYRSEYSGGYANAFEVSGGIMLSFGPPAALEVVYGHQWQEGLGRPDNDAIGVTLTGNPEPGTQVYIATTSNLLTRNDSFRFYHIGNINQVYSLGVKWVF